MRPLVDAVRRGLKSLQKDAPLTAVEWADKYFYMSSESSYGEGKWTTEAFQVALLNAMGNDLIEELNLLKSARVGYTKMASTPAPSVVVNAPAAPAPSIERQQPASRVPSPAPVILSSPPAAKAARPEVPGPVSLNVKVSAPPPADLPAGAVAPSSAPPAFDPSKAMLPEAEIRPGDVVRAMALPKAPKAAQAAAPYLAAVAQKAAPVKVEQKFEISAPFHLTVQGDVKDPDALVRELMPRIEVRFREIAQQLSSRTLYDDAHV
jgi:hypothetical protein